MLGHIFVLIAALLTRFASVAGSSAIFGETKVTVTIKTGTYPFEQRWAIVPVNKTSLYYQYRGQQCPGYMDGGSGQRKSESYKYKCMSSDKNFQVKLERKDGMCVPASCSSTTTARTTNGDPSTILPTNSNCDFPASGSAGEYNKCTKLGSNLERDIVWFGNPETRYPPTITGTNDLQNGQYGDKRKVYTHTMVLEAGQDYRFRAVDAYGDGWNSGYFQVQRSNGTRSMDVVPPTSMPTGFLLQSGIFTTPVPRTCKAGYYCPVPSQEIKCGNYTVYCPEGSFSPTNVPSGHCGAKLAIANDYATATASAPCSELLVTDSDTGLQEVRINATQPETKVVTLKLKNNGPHTISWNCWASGTNLADRKSKLKQKTVGTPAWAVQPNGTCYQRVSGGDADSVDWIVWDITGGDIAPNKDITVQMRVVSANMEAGKTFASKLRLSFVTPAEATLEPTVQTASFLFTVQVNPAQVILVFPFELSSTLRVGEKQTHDVFVFNIGKNVNEFGVVVKTPGEYWAEMDDATFCNKQAYTNATTTVKGLALNGLPPYCKVQNDRTFKKYSVVMNAANVSSRTAPYYDTMVLDTTLEEQVSIRLKMQVNAGETDVDKTTVTGIADVTVQTPLSIKIEAKDILGGASTAADTFFVEWKKVNFVNLELNSTLSDCQPTGGCSSGVIQSSPSATKANVHIIDFTPQQYGTYSFSIKLQGQHVAASPYSFMATSPVCEDTVAVINPLREACECNKGYYQASTTSVTGSVSFSCEPCPSNSYKDTTGDKPCTKCPAFSNTGNAVAQTSLEQCKCDAHRNRANTGSTFQCPCESGYGGIGGNCTQCAPGERNRDKETMSSTCEKCEAGTSQINPGQTSCVACLEGKYSSSNGAKSCTDCERGKYVNAKNGKKCQDCGRGEYQDEEGGKECKECPAGTEQPNTMSTYCNDCAGGHYQNLPKQTTCKKCATGKIVDVNTTGATACTDCPLHHWSCHPDATGLYPAFEQCIGQTDCSACPAGTQNEPSKTGTDCTNCVEGKFSRNGGKGCQPCPSGFFAASKGATRCVECGRNEYAPRGSSQCLSCPLGLVIDKSLGPAKDESSCVCDRGSFLYPYIFLSLILPGETTSSVGFDSAKSKENVRDALGNAGSSFTRASGLKTGLPLSYGYERVTLSTSLATEAGFKAVFKIAARDARRGTIENLLNVYNSTEKVQALFQKYYDTRHINQRDYDVIQTKWTNVASIEAHVYKQCEPCPPGGFCAFGSVGTENIAALPGFWRPENSYARFWQCPIPSMNAGKLYPWLACYGGKSSVCGPVFNFDETLTGSVTIKEQLVASDFEAMPEGEFNYQQELDLRNTSSTLDVAIVSYLNDLVYDRANVSFLDALDRGELYVKGWSRKKNLVVGEYSGPMCTVCPSNSGRDGNFQSGTVCTPCPPPVNNVLSLAGLSILVLLILGAMVASQVTKGSMERELLRKLEQEIKEGETHRKSRSSTVDNEGIELTGEAATAHEHRKNQQLYGSYSGTELSHKQILTGMFRILAAYLQVTALAQSVPIAWTDEVREVMKAMEKISSPSLSMTSVDCAISTDDPSAGNSKAFFKKFYAMMLVPILSVVVPGVFFLLYYLIGSFVLGCTGLKCWPNRLPEKEFLDEKEIHKTKLANVENVYQYNLFRHRQRSNRRFKVTAMIILFLFYTTICKSVVESFACRTFGSKQYLIADLSVECKGEDFEFHRNLGILCFILYNLGIPFFAYRVLHPYIDGIHFDPTHVVSVDNPPKTPSTQYSEKDKTVLIEQKATSHGAFGFLWQGLSEKGLAPYWEVVVISLRKLIMICVIMLMSELNPNIQMTVALLILFFFTLLHVNYRPYDAFVHDNLELFSLLVSQITLFIGLLANFFKNEQESDLATITEAQGIQINNIFGIVVVIVNAAFMVYFILSLIFHSFFMIGKPKRLLLEKWCWCFCVCCKQCHEVSDKVNFMKRNSFSYRSEDNIYDRDNRGDIEMQRHKRGKTIDGSQEELLKLNFTVPEGVRAGEAVYVKSPSGHKVKVVVPKGAKAGQVISVTVPPDMQPPPPPPLTQNPMHSMESIGSDLSGSEVDDDYDDDDESNLVI